MHGYPADSIFGKLIFRPDGESPPGRTGCADAGFLRPQAAPRYISTLYVCTPPSAVHFRSLRNRCIVSAGYPCNAVPGFRASGPAAYCAAAVIRKSNTPPQAGRRHMPVWFTARGDKIGIRKGILLWEIHRFGNIVPGNSARILSCLSG